MREKGGKMIGPPCEDTPSGTLESEQLTTRQNCIESVGVVVWTCFVPWEFMCWKHGPRYVGVRGVRCTPVIPELRRVRQED